MSLAVEELVRRRITGIKKMTRNQFETQVFVVVEKIIFRAFVCHKESHIKRDKVDV